ncbi:MAG: hypothetical protein GKS06_12795 [Acidobacteria bacterium]|nr:hypothetical protein [Acidobacteriota bacterium]
MRHFRRTILATAAALAIVLVAPATAPAQSATPAQGTSQQMDLEMESLAAVEGELTIRPGDRFRSLRFAHPSAQARQVRLQVQAHQDPDGHTHEAQGRDPQLVL